MSDESPQKASKQSTSFIRKLTKLFIDPAKQVGIKDIRAKETVLHQGWLRKKNTSMVGKARDTMNMKWNMFYVLVTEKSIYYFKNETASSFVGKFSLFGYNVVKRVPIDVNSNNSAKWPEQSIMIEHASGDPSQYKTYYFACAHYDEWKTWMQSIRKALIKANDSLFSNKPRIDLGSPVDKLEHPIYPATDFLAHQKSKAAADNEDVESDDEDYEVIKDDFQADQMGTPQPPPRPKKQVSHKSSNLSESYMEFDESPSDKKGFRKTPSIPSPGSEESYQDHSANTTGLRSPTINNLPKYLHVESSPAMDVLADLKERQRQLKDTCVPASMPRNPAPGKPIPPANKPVPPANKPLMPVNKPILPVKPRMLEKIYWNGSKEDATRVIRESYKGTFLIRWGSTGNQKVLVVSDGGGESHSLKINEFSNGQMGLKNEALSSDLEKFSSVDALVKFYKETPINLRSGAVEIKLKTPHPLCAQTLD